MYFFCSVAMSDGAKDKGSRHKETPAVTVPRMDGWRETDHFQQHGRVKNNFIHLDGSKQK